MMKTAIKVYYKYPFSPVILDVEVRLRHRASKEG
jgi:hypothetical protein